MKRVLIGVGIFLLLAAVFHSQVRAADSSHCNILDHGPEINKTKLSERDICWLETHRPDKGNGVLGSIFYVKVQDLGYVSMPLKELHRSSDVQATVFAHINAAFAKDEERHNEKIREQLIQELNLIRSEIAQFYGFVILNGMPEDGADYIQELVLAEIELTEILYGN